MKKIYLFLIVLFPVFLYSQVEPRTNAEELISVDVPFDNIKRIFVPNDAAVIHAVDLSVREKLKKQFERDSANYAVEVHLDNTPLVDDGMVYKTKSGSLPMYYPEYNIKVDLSSLTQNHYEMIEEEQIARKSDSPFSYVMIYRIVNGQLQEPIQRIVRHYKVDVWFSSGRHHNFWARIISNHDSNVNAAAYNYLYEIDNVPEFNLNDQLDFDH